MRVGVVIAMNEEDLGLAENPRELDLERLPGSMSPTSTIASSCSFSTARPACAPAAEVSVGQAAVLMN